MKRILTGLVFLCTAIVAHAQESFPINGVRDIRSGLYAFTNATIVQNSTTKIEKATLLIKQGKIIAVGTTVAVPVDAVVVDCNGKYIYPSFVDAYTNYGVGAPARPSGGFNYGAPAQFVSNKPGAYNWNQAIKPEVNAYEIFATDESAASGFRANGFGTVFTHVKDGIVRGTGAVVTLANSNENNAILKTKAAQVFSFDKGTSTQSYPASLMGSMALLRQTYMDASWYLTKPTGEGTNLSLEALNINKTLPQIFSADDKWSAVRADRMGDEFGVQYIIRGADNGYQRIDEIKKTKATYILGVDFPAAMDVEDPNDARFVSLADMKHWELAPTNLGAFEKANIPFSISIADMKDAKQFLGNLRKAIQNGLTESRALEALTKTPANLLGVYDQVGSIETGKLANFIITTDPIFSANAKIIENWVQGNKYDVTFTKDLINDLQEEEEVPVDEFEMSNEDLNEYNYDEDVADYKTKDDYYPELDNDTVIPIKAEVSLHELLMNQLSMLALEDQAYKIAEQIIGSLDDDGYLRRALRSIADDLAFKQSMLVEEKEIESVLLLIQQFDPAGIAARNLQECLLLQLKRKLEEESSPSNELRKIAIVMIEKHFEEFTRKHYDKIQKSLHLDDKEMKEVLHQILNLNPKPGAETSHQNEAEMYIIPDFTVHINNGKLELILNSRNAPPLIISDDYKMMLKEYDRGNKQDKSQKEAVFFIKQKIDAAKWFIEMIQQRQQTLLLTMRSILIHQEAFFMSGDTTQLRPMILKDIAEKTNLDVSTVSRVANSKYVQTEFGTFLLKHFFSESLMTDSGEEVSTKEVKAILQEFIQLEDKHKPLSDDELTEQLQQRGYNIARRTVAKYRELLNIPVARLRKEL